MVNLQINTECIWINDQRTFADLEGRQLVGADAGADTGAAGSTIVQSLLFHYCEVISRAKLGFQVKRWATTAKPSLRDDGNAVTKQLRLIHVVGGENNRPV